ncbi:putative Retinol dehydrogenase 12 [Monocercomonoides exilis]|uniref:putative Retinol dehydrogenase 12 n=1 Tax=Monocercomonoides exilis TaxID=2049356 RepID=UPI00355A1129|nr:putative Retinol dehydrogenase 12 [Monocercomonoides exilis]|eukprot:MONOS_657.1-p1 / transcript=MONOS_657.1 / gene=MONOS_657 / organism=Monocercomonoides_exilis_PA203 / gene_product=Retinol dehydrogenase 12 / transcript_product=Retinol dehydrogenase 12 / location=Mono_scaffold00011:45968-47252(-) / protein_length=257 / sequence_SO=supercontig / SO=protein_coding / is_pseudo=false
MGCTEAKYSISKVNTDHYTSLREVQLAIRKAGLESSNLIFGIDYTGSNQVTGEKSFGGRSLHDLTVKNPYMEVIEILGETLEDFDDDHIIPAYAFGDEECRDQKVKPFFPNRHCRGFREVLERYREITPLMDLAGPTDFAPLIRETIRIVKEERSYHILVIVTDGQVNEEKSTINAIVEATNYPISIICVGVGDGPWDMMHTFDDRIPKRKFDNFQFVEFNKVKSQHPTNLYPSFALEALMEIPEQYKAIRQLGMLN